jgi:hypothetical protein
MSQDLVKDEIRDKDWNKAKDELSDMLSRFGWKWAVLASTVNKLYNEGYAYPKDLVSRIRTSRVQIESGCYSICDVASELREIEKEVFSSMMKNESQDTDQFLYLIAKAINGTIKEEDVDFSGAKTVLSDCLSLPCICN